VKRSARCAAVAALMLFAPGCYRVAYRSHLPAGGRIHREKLDYWFWGLRGHHEINLDKICPEGVRGWHTDATAFNLWNVFTLGIYAPRTLVVECARTGGAP